MRRTLAILGLVGLPALVVALGGVRLVLRDRAAICATVAGKPPCTCGCRAAHARADAETAARATRMTIEAGAAIMLLLVLILGGAAAVFAADSRRVRRAARANRAFVADISHRLRTPLTGIRLNADLLKEGRLEDEAERRAAVAAMAEESARLSALVEKLLDHVARH